MGDPDTGEVVVREKVQLAVGHLHPARHINPFLLPQGVGSTVQRPPKTASVSKSRMNYTLCNPRLSCLSPGAHATSCLWQLVLTQQVFSQQVGVTILETRKQGSDGP